jgi:3-hydroxyacyl-CoA dehydrogenase/enoyl-CoA hydratase/3-hydroxybutyryl-CoA epimerase
LSGVAALECGVIDELVPPGEEIAAAERWIMSCKQPRQKWDDGRTTDVDALNSLIEAQRETVLQETLGHYPAPLAILECVRTGLLQSFDEALRTETGLFAKLIQRREARNLIRTLFQGRVDYERLRKSNSPLLHVKDAVQEISNIFSEEQSTSQSVADAFARAGFKGATRSSIEGWIASDQFWIEADPITPAKNAVRYAISRAATAAGRWRKTFSLEQCRIADYLMVTQEGFPGYLGGIFVEAPLQLNSQGYSAAILGEQK